jgi:hypothetical protein
MAASDGAWLATHTSCDSPGGLLMTALGRVKRILIGALLGAALTGAYFLGAGAVHAVSTASHAAPRMLAGGCPGVSIPC